MATQTLKLEVPEFISIEKYKEINSFEGDNKFGQLVHSVSKITDKPISEVRNWSIDSLTKIVNVFAEIADHNQEFHSIIEWNGTLYGFAHMKQATLGEYIDLESLCKDLKTNMHKVAAILYRPITKHRFNSLEFITKQTIKMAKNEVENVFDWYTVEDYDSDKRRDREEQFKGFPIHIFLGALNFFLSTGSLYLNNIAYSQKKISKKMMKATEKEILESLSANTGAGGGLFTTSLSPTYYKYLETSQ